jgi:hypothetical protein
VIAGGIAKDAEFLERFNPLVDKAEFEEVWSKRTTGDAAGPSYEPNYEGSSVVIGPKGARIGASGSHSFAARAGHHLSPLVLSSGENVYEALGEGFTLLSLDAEESDVALCEADAEKAGIPLTIVRDSFADDRMEFEARLVLVRPDQFVVWAADSAPPDMTALLAKVTGSSS